jgi:hypothetical protein
MVQLMLNGYFVIKHSGEINLQTTIIMNIYKLFLLLVIYAFSLISRRDIFSINRLIMTSTDYDVTDKNNCVSFKYFELQNYHYYKLISYSEVTFTIL